MKNRIISLTLIGLISSAWFSIDAQSVFYPESYEWYRLVSYSSSSEGEAKCIQLTPQDAGEHPGELWSADLLDKDSEDIDYQYFTFEQNPENPEEFAMICVGAPGGYVDPTPTQYDRGGRWRYIFADDITEESPNKYGFVFKGVKARNASGISDGIPCFAIATDSKLDKADYLMNYGGQEDGYAIDLSSGDDSDNPDNSLFKFVEKKDIITQNIGETDVNKSVNTDITYNLLGIRIQTPQKGLYVNNGRLIAK